MGDYTNIIKCGVPGISGVPVFFLKQYGFLKKLGLYEYIRGYA